VALLCTAAAVYVAVVVEWTCVPALKVTMLSALFECGAAAEVVSSSAGVVAQQRHLYVACTEALQANARLSIIR
jgi:hypothetical protein